MSGRAPRRRPSDASSPPPRPQVEIDPTQGTRHSVYIAFCDGATIIIKGKCKGVAVDACAKSEVRMESAISSLEIVNSTNA